MLIDPQVQLRNDIFLQNSLERFIFSFKTNKKILKGMVFLSICYPASIGDFLDKNIETFIPVREEIEKLHQESLNRIVDLFYHGKKSEVVKMNPSGHMHRRKLVKDEFKAFFFKPLKIPTTHIFGYRKKYRTGNPKNT